MIPPMEEVERLAGEFVRSVIAQHGLVVHQDDVELSIFKVIDGLDRLWERDMSPDPELFYKKFTKEEVPQ